MPDWSGIVHLISYGNIGSSYARGLEAAYQQKFTFLPKPFDGLGFEGNITYVSSSGCASARRDTCTAGHFADDFQRLGVL